jgi:hypothetical protein
LRPKSENRQLGTAVDADGSFDHLRAVPVALASRTVLQVDQAAPTHQALLRNSENDVKTQVWIAVAVYVLVAIVRKRLNLELSLHEMLQILSVTPFEKTPLFQLLTHCAIDENINEDPNQLILLETCRTLVILPHEIKTAERWCASATEMQPEDLF